MAAVALAAAAVALALVFGGKQSAGAGRKPRPRCPGAPSVEIISPRNGARQNNHAVVVKVAVENFELAPRQFGREPQLGEGHLRFSLKRVPDCVDPKKLADAINSPVGKGRLVGKSFDYAKYAGPNGVLAEQIGSAGSYSPATRPEIFYHGLAARLLPPDRQPRPEQRHDDPVPRRHQLPDPAAARATTPKTCEEGKVPSAKAARSRLDP